MMRRICREEGINLRDRRSPCREAAAHGAEQSEVSTTNEFWVMGFAVYSLFNGHRIRTLSVVDNFSRECLAITVDRNLHGDDVVDTMEHIKSMRGAPKRIQVDNGSEFASKARDLRAYENGVTLDLSRPGKLTDNPFIESFNGSFRDECLNRNWFRSLDDAQQKVEAWRVDYNEHRPLQSSNDRIPQQFITEH